MKLSFSFILSSLLLLSLVLAVDDIVLLQEEYVAGDTLGFYFLNSSSLSSSQISMVYNDTEISIAPLYQEYLDGQYFIYLNLDTSLTPGNYTLYVQSSQQSFTLIDGSDALRMKPGFIVLDESEDSFELEVTAMLRDTTVTITSSHTGTLRPRKNLKSLTTSDVFTLIVDYDYDEMVEDGALTFTYADRIMSVPVLFTGELAEEGTVNETNTTTLMNETESNVTVSDDVVEEEEDVVALSFDVNTEEVSVSIAEGELLEDSLIVTNELNETLLDLSFSLTGNLAEIVSLNLTEVESLGPGESVTVLVTIDGTGSLRDTSYSGDVVFANDDYSVRLPISVEIGEEEEETEEETVDEETELIVYEGETYEGEEGVSSSIIIGVIIILLLLGLIILVVTKLRQKQEKQFDQYIQETKKK